ncbi:MAG: hypothetical protein M3R02_19240 [Chloroflexota bacterium]|nr:hypothetical protein [Chloroflexota bacterium]
MPTHEPDQLRLDPWLAVEAIPTLVRTKALAISGRDLLDLGSEDGESWFPTNEVFPGRLGSLIRRVSDWGMGGYTTLTP